MKIVAGIDFGTSMSMIQTLDHDSPQPDALACQTVRFTQSAQAATPTLVRVDRESGAESFGEEAQTAHEGVMYENFKLDLWSEDAQKIHNKIRSMHTILPTIGMKRTGCTRMRRARKRRPWWDTRCSGARRSER